MIAHRDSIIAITIAAARPASSVIRDKHQTSNANATIDALAPTGPIRASPVEAGRVPRRITSTVSATPRFASPSDSPAPAISTTNERPTGPDTKPAVRSAIARITPRMNPTIGKQTVARERCAALPCDLSSRIGHRVSVAAASTASNSSPRTPARLVSLADSIVAPVDYNRSRQRYDRQ